jgi:hypothetical protein
MICTFVVDRMHRNLENLVFYNFYYETSFIFYQMSKIKLHLIRAKSVKIL